MKVRKEESGWVSRSGVVKERKRSLTTVGIAYVGPLVGYNRVGGPYYERVNSGTHNVGQETWGLLLYDYS